MIEGQSGCISTVAIKALEYGKFTSLSVIQKIAIFLFDDPSFHCFVELSLLVIISTLFQSSRN